MHTVWQVTSWTVGVNMHHWNTNSLKQPWGSHYRLLWCSRSCGLRVRTEKLTNKYRPSCDWDNEDILRSQCCTELNGDSWAAPEITHSIPVHHIGRWFSALTDKMKFYLKICTFSTNKYKTIWVFYLLWWCGQVMTPSDLSIFVYIASIHFFRGQFEHVVLLDKTREIKPETI